MTQDLVYAVRSFRRSPAFTAVALLSLALGIGATCAIFSVIYGVLIAPYPYAKPDEIWSPEIVSLDHRSARGYLLDELPRVKALPAFSDVMATSGESVLMTGEFGPESFGGVLLTANAFNFLGVPPIAGRTIQPSDIRPDGSAEPVVVLSHKLWLRLFDGSPAALGRTLTLNGQPHTIIGVMPPRFGWYGSDSFWLPLAPARTDLFNISARSPPSSRIPDSWSPVSWRTARARTPSPASSRAKSPQRFRRRLRRRGSPPLSTTISTSRSPAATCRPASAS